MAEPFEPLEPAVMFWAGRDPRETLAELKALGVRCGQLGVPGDLDLSCAGAWKDALDQAQFTVYTVFAAFEGESYADIPTVERTVGFVPPATREVRESRMLAISGFAAVIGAPGIATHIGFVDGNSIAVREIVQRVCDRTAANGQTFALETGQERAEVLLDFIRDVKRENLGINFDPANMILYGTGDPIEALCILAKHALSVHCKDGDWPPAGHPDELGEERALGHGSVGIERFVAALKEIGYTGPLAIERESSDPEGWLRDIAAGLQLLRIILRR